jgi:hypothetical protein
MGAMGWDADPAFSESAGARNAASSLILGLMLAPPRWTESGESENYFAHLKQLW